MSNYNLRNHISGSFWNLLLTYYAYNGQNYLLLELNTFAFNRCAEQNLLEVLVAFFTYPHLLPSEIQFDDIVEFKVVLFVMQKNYKLQFQACSLTFLFVVQQLLNWDGTKGKNHGILLNCFCICIEVVQLASWFLLAMQVEVDRDASRLKSWFFVRKIACVDSTIQSLTDRNMTQDGGETHSLLTYILEHE